MGNCSNCKKSSFCKKIDSYLMLFWLGCPEYSLDKAMSVHIPFPLMIQFSSKQCPSWPWLMSGEEDIYSRKMCPVFFSVGRTATMILDERDQTQKDTFMWHHVTNIFHTPSPTKGLIIYFTLVKSVLLAVTFYWQCGTGLHPHTWCNYYIEFQNKSSPFSQIPPAQCHAWGWVGLARLKIFGVLWIRRGVYESGHARRVETLKTLIYAKQMAHITRLSFTFC